MQPDPSAPGARTGVATQGAADKRRTFPCSQCGANLEFHIGDQVLKCPYCGHTRDLEPQLDAAPIAERDLLAMLQTLRETSVASGAGRVPQPARHEVRCRACAATVTFEGTLTSDACSFCGSPIQLDDVHDSPVRVTADGVLPFRVTRSQVAERLRAWVKSRWFAPNDFKRSGVRGKFQSVYLPFWTFDAITFSRYRGERGEHYLVTVGSGKNRRTETRVRWRSVSGHVRELFDDVLVCALRHSAVDLIHELEPWPLHQIEPYRPELLAGHQARTYDLELGEGFEQAKGAMREAIEHSVRRDIGGDVQRISSLHTDYSALTFKHLLLPVWLMAYRHGGESYQVVINACTGEVQGERPYSAVKIALATLAALVLGGLLWWLNR